MAGSQYEAPSIIDVGSLHDLTAQGAGDPPGKAFSVADGSDFEGNEPDDPDPGVS